MVKYYSKTKKKKNFSDEIIEDYEKELKTVLTSVEIDNLRNTVSNICDTTDLAHAHIYMSFVIDEIRNFNKQKQNLDLEFLLADKIYKEIVEDEEDLNINSRLLIANLMKFNNIIEQNNEIIKLIKENKD